MTKAFGKGGEIGIGVDKIGGINAVGYGSDRSNGARTLHAKNVVDEFESPFVPQFRRQCQGLHDGFDAGDDARRQFRRGGKTRF